MKDKNRIRGKKAQHIGNIFEKYIEAACIRYRTLGIADIKKTPEPMRPIGVINNNRGWYKAIFEKKGQPDFLGTLKGGRSIMIEAKHTDSKYMRFDRIATHQERDLKSTADLGGLSLILLSYNLKNFYCIEWNDWLRLKNLDSKKKSLKEEDLIDYKIEYKNGVIQFLTGKGTARAADESN